MFLLSLSCMFIRTMKLEKLLFLFTGLTLFVGCTSSTPEIRTICLRDDIGNYIIKWETEPQIEGILKMYVSDNPDTFNRSLPAGYANINDGVTTYITNDNISRKYFLLSFNDKYFQTVGARSVPMDSIQNFRDIGGYFTAHNQMSRWGKVYRSGQLGALSDRDSVRLDNLGIKTIIDLRTEKEVAVSPFRYTKANVVNVPVDIKDMDKIVERIQEGRMRKGDGMLFLQDAYLQFVTESSGQFAKALKPFLEKNNYPILVNCSIGKDRAGFLMAMLLSALDIPEEIVRKDYMASNEYINISRLAFMARDLSTDSQETITVLVSANEGLMDLVFRKIRKDHGSTDKYLSKGLHLSEKQRDTIKDIMLY